MNYYKITDLSEQQTERKYKKDDELKWLTKCRKPKYFILVRTIN